jgi:hypothetical protein
MNYSYFYFLLVSATLYSGVACAQNIQNNPASNHGNKFEQLGTILPDANTYRTASGAPGHEYWQQRADYVIEAKLDEENLKLHGKETITYHNQSPDALPYLWLQLDENEHHPEAEAKNFDGSKITPPVTASDLERLDVKKMLEGYGVNILSVSDAKGQSLPFTINQTMMRVDLPVPLKPGAKYTFRVEWNYKIPERLKIGGRGGYEFFPEDGNHLFTISQWFPRMCVYSDYQGWNHKQFTGRGEFSLPFGNYSVSMDVPADHVVCATGMLQNASEVLSAEQSARWKKAQNATEPVEVVTLDEARKREQNPEKENRKIWRFRAENVRDFAWGSSRKFIWDAMKNDATGKKTLCMSFYPKEAYALYRRYSTKVVSHTINVYSKFTIPYPYPVAISVEASSGMEYPMICFNYGRTNADGTYSERLKYGMISVIIHEVGHNFFPMIINSDERNWSWMDEGLNTFVQFLAEQEFDNDYPSSRGPAHKIATYMAMPPDQLEPIMTNSENIINFGANAYGKPATALNILRETVMGRKLFDYAFKEYARRWAFKHPSPADFFRSMEDASGVDLDWFWRGWFFDIQPVDISLDSVKTFLISDAGVVSTKVDSVTNRGSKEDTFRHISKIRNRESGMTFLVDTDTTLRDYHYYAVKEQAAQPKKTARSQADYLENVDEKTWNEYKGKYYYELHFSNKGGLVMPIILKWTYADGTEEIERINAYIWRKNEKSVVKTFFKGKEVVGITLDPFRETADTDESNHSWPTLPLPDKVELFKAKSQGRR